MLFFVGGGDAIVKVRKDKIGMMNTQRPLPKYLILSINIIFDFFFIYGSFLLCKNYTHFLYLIGTIFIINCLFFDYCKKHIPYSKISIFYLWQFQKQDFKYVFGKTCILFLLFVLYFIYFD